LSPEGTAIPSQQSAYLENPLRILRFFNNLGAYLTKLALVLLCHCKSIGIFSEEAAMSKMLNHEMITHLFEEKRTYSIGLRSAGVLLIVFALTGDFLPIPVRVAAVLIGTSLFFKGRHAAEEDSGLFDGAVEEESTTEALATIPKEWIRINHLAVGKSKIDHVLVGPKGIYSIKAKNFRGTIDGNLDERTWGQISPDGERSIVFNPIKEASANASELQKHIHQAGFPDVRVKPIVIFTDPTAQFRVSSPKVPVVRSAELGDLLRKQPHVMMPEKCAEMAKLLHGLVSRQNSKKRLTGKSDSREKNDPVLDITAFKTFVINGKR
jgi:hypothetical protein